MKRNEDYIYREVQVLTLDLLVNFCFVMIKVGTPTKYFDTSRGAPT